MKKLKLLLVNPVEKSSSSFRNILSSRYPPLGLSYIAALTPPNWDVEIIDENFEDFKFISADLVGISSFTASINRTYQIASIYKKHKIPVVLGGIHASMVPDEAKKYVTTVVVGEAESVWNKVLNDFTDGKLNDFYYGDRVSLNNLVFPKRDILHKNYKMATILTSRGCPMNCEFCSVSSFNGGKFRQRPIKEVLDELETIKQKLVFFVDDNLLGYGDRNRERAIALFKGMRQRRIKKYWWAQASLNIGYDNELLAYAAKSGCKALFIGLESIDNKTLVSMNKVVNAKIDAKNYQNIFKNIHKHGIAVWGAMMVGNDTDTKSTFSKLADFIIKSSLDISQITFSTPLPGTKLYERLSKENRIIFDDYPKDWQYYFFQNLVHEPKGISIKEAYNGMRELKNKVYSSRVLTVKFFQTLFYTKSLIVAIFAYRINSVYQQLFHTYKYYNKS